MPNPSKKRRRLAATQALQLNPHPTTHQQAPPLSSHLPLEANPSSSSSPTSSHPSDVHSLFTSLARKKGILITSVQPAQLPGKGTGLVATAPIPEGTQILFVPESAMFKPDDPALLKARGLDEKVASPHAKLAFSLMRAAKRAARGKGRGEQNEEDGGKGKGDEDGEFLRAWKRTWPGREELEGGLPFFWGKGRRHEYGGGGEHDDGGTEKEVEGGERLLELLPPSVKQPLERQRSDFERDFEVVRKAIAEFDDAENDADDAGCVRKTGSDRGRTFRDWAYYWFVVNSRCFHFKPMPPQQQHAGGGRRRVPEKPGFMVMCPFIDYLNHGPSGSGCIVRQTRKGYEVVADRDYDIGEEILGTYGAQPNEKLLIHYGFVCSNDPTPSVDDDVRLDHSVLSHFDDVTKQQLQDVGYLGGYALIPSTESICFRTQVAVRIAILTSSEWEYFITNGEDLSGDQSQSVNDWLRPKLERYRDEACSKLKQINLFEENYAKFLLRTRWNQISDALTAFMRATAPKH